LIFLLVLIVAGLSTATPRGNNLCREAHRRIILWKGFNPWPRCSARGWSESEVVSPGWGHDFQRPVHISVSGTSRFDVLEVQPSSEEDYKRLPEARRSPCASGDESRVALSSVRTKSEHERPDVSRLINIRKIHERRIGKNSAGRANTSVDTEADEKPSQIILKSLTQPLIPRSMWAALTGREFFAPSCLPLLTKTGIKTATSSDDIISWKPDKHTHKLADAESASAGGILRNAVDDGDILVWTGRFKSDGHGSELPLVKTTWKLDMEPKAFAELLMDSSRVRSYNKMSLGRTDAVKFQVGIDSTSEKYGSGEAKIVRNLTKPPLSKRNMEFVTLMHARHLEDNDNAGIGLLGGGSEGAYVVVSRAVGGNGWASDISSCARGGGASGGDEFIRSEILLGVNVIRAVPGHPGKSEVTAVTHCNSPSVPRALAGKIGVKGAVDFVRDVRSLCN